MRQVCLFISMVLGMAIGVVGPVHSGVTGGGGDGCGCSIGETTQWPDAVSRLAERQGLDGAEAKRIYDDLISKRYDDLFLYSGDEHPCDMYGECGEGIPEDFLQKLISLAMKYQEVELAKWQGKWAAWAAIASAFFALVSLLGPAIGILHRRWKGGPG